MAENVSSEANNEMNSKNAATESYFGWVFQIAASIFVSLDNIQRLESVKVEGQNEDIEISFTDKTRWYYQSKSCYEPENYNNRLSSLAKTLKSFGEHQGEASSLIYISNFKVPIPKANDYFPSYGVNLSFSLLPEERKEYIKSLSRGMKKQPSFEKIRFQTLLFFHDDYPRFPLLRDKLDEFFLSINVHGSSDKVINIWDTLYAKNCVTRTVTIKKDDIVGPIIIGAFRGIKDNLYNRTEEECDIEDACSIYESIFLYNAFGAAPYSVTTQIVFSFVKEYGRLFCDDNFVAFVNKHWEEFLLKDLSKDALDGNDHHTKEEYRGATKYFMLLCLTRVDSVDRINEGVSKL
jgi:hypothetical protein